MRVLALDIGDKRIGVAVSDAAGSVASPLVVLQTAAVLSGGRELHRLLDDYEVEEIVIGLPLSLDGTEGPQARHVRALAARLEPALAGRPVSFFDERLSSGQAKRSMAESGATEREMRGAVDKVAAALFLQAFLDARRVGDRAADSD